MKVITSSRRYIARFHGNTNDNTNGGGDDYNTTNRIVDLRVSVGRNSHAHRPMPRGPKTHSESQENSKLTCQLDHRKKPFPAAASKFTGGTEFRLASAAPYSITTLPGGK